MPPPLCPVVSVADGDTIRLRIRWKNETARLIGLDTPETRDPRRPVECFCREASKQTTKLLKGEKVRISDDPRQDTRDRYGRLLLYVWLPGKDVSVNQQLIRQGYAVEYTYEEPYFYQKQFRKAEQAARRERAGLWSPRTCDGDPDKPAATPTPRPVPPTPTPIPPPADDGGEDAYYANCTEAREAGAAPLYRGDPGYGSHLDRDDDGVACEG